MLPDTTLQVPASLMTLLTAFAPLFTAPSFRTFTMLACGFLAQPGRRTVCGMLSGAGLARLWPHDRAHWFFSRARWNPDDLGLAAAKLVVALLVPAGEPVLVAIDDTLFRRGRKVWAASWFHDGSAQGKHKTGRGNNWVVLAIVVSLPFCTRPFALPVMAKLVVKGTSSASRLWLARRMTSSLADALPGRDLHAVADSAYAGEELKKLGKNVTWTTRLRKDAALHGLPPERTGKRGRPRVRGARLPKLAGLAAATAFTQVTVTRYGKTETVQAAAITCLWYTVFGTRPVQVILVRDKSASGYDLARAGHAPTRAPIGPWFRPWARLAPIVATMPTARLHLARGGTGWCRRLASSTTMDAAQISPSTVNGSRRAVRPVSPWDVTNS